MNGLINKMVRIETTRTILRRQVDSDFEAIRELESNPLIMKFTPSKVPQTEQQTRVRFQSQIEKQSSLEPFGVWVCELKKDKSVIGWFMLMPTNDKKLEIGFMLNQKFWRKGFTTEAAQALIEYAKAYHHIKVISAKTTLSNLVSMHTLKNLGFNDTGTAQVPDRNTGNPVDVQTFELVLKK